MSSPDDPPPAGPIAVARAVRPTEAELRVGRRRLHAKAAIIGSLVISSYVCLVFADISIALRIGCALVLAVGIVSVGTSVMHDANHGAFSRSRRVNQFASYSADLIGASSWVWRFKHNTLHHANTNVVGIDSDIDQAPFARLAPQQPWHPWHRYQHLYLWVLYGFLTAKWFFVSDIAAVIHGGIDDSPFPTRPRSRDVAVIATGKAVHLSWALLVPLLFHPWWGVLAFYAGCSWLVGFLLAMVFQLAHCTDRVDFLGEPSTGPAEPFVVRQLRTTADIRCRGPATGAFLRWMMGGLDHQIEHHLAPRLPHTMYPTMAARLEPLCAQRALTYHVHHSVWSAIAEHARWLRTMGQEPT